MRDEAIQQILFDYDSESTSQNVKDSVEKLQNELAKFGISRDMSKVYIYLGKYGSKTAINIVRALKMPRTAIYSLLKVLMSKGLVYATMRYPMKFAATPLERAIVSIVSAEKQRVNNLETNSKNLAQLWTLIPDFLKNEMNEIESKFQILEGTNQICTKITEMSKKSNQIQLLCAEKDLMKLYHNGMFDKTNRSEKYVQVLISKTLQLDDILKKSQEIEIKKIPSEIQDDLNFAVNNDELLFYIKHSNESPLKNTAIWTNSTALNYSMRILFSYLWSSSPQY